MQVTLIHNPSAGDKRRLGAVTIQKMIRKAGHEVRYQSSKDENWEEVLNEPADLVAVAGGDGTVAKVARRLVGRSVAFTVLPLGTANNISRSLRIADLDFAELIAGWHGARRHKLDAGAVLGPVGKLHFIEGVGVGLFAWMVPRADADKKLARIDDAGEAVAYALKMMRKRLHEHEASRVQANLDGVDVSGDYVMFEAMNMQYIGPNLFLAPQGDPGDGLLDVVAVTEAERDHFDEHLADWRQGGDSAPQLTTFRGQQLKMEQGCYDLHIDDQIWPGNPEPLISAAPSIEVRILPGALDVLLPQAGAGVRR